MREQLTRRYRVRRGRVMHRVIRVTAGGSTDLESQCRKTSGIKGVTATYPRVQGPEDEWSDKPSGYPNCPHCPDIEEDRNA